MALFFEREAGREQQDKNRKVVKEIHRIQKQSTRTVGVVVCLQPFACYFAA